MTYCGVCSLDVVLLSYTLTVSRSQPLFFHALLNFHENIF